jgi:hypothetical protein
MAEVAAKSEKAACAKRKQQRRFCAVAAMLAAAAIFPLAGTGAVFSSHVGTAQAAQATTVSFTTAGTLSSIQVLTQGAPNLDFSEATGGTCATGTVYAAGKSCTVNVVFAARYSGARNGAIVLTGSNGDVLGTAYLQGKGIGPQIVYGAWFGTGAQPTSQKLVEIPGTGDSTGVAVDGSDNLYVALSTGTQSSPNGGVIRLPWNGTAYGTPVTIAGGAFAPVALALDAAGNLYYIDSTNAAVKRVTWNGSAYTTPAALPFTGLVTPSAVAVDDRGAVYIVDSSTNNVLEVPWTASGYGAQKLLGTFSGNSLNPFSVAVAGAGAVGAGNIYVGVYGNNDLKLWVNTAGDFYTVPTTFNGTQGMAVDGAGDVYFAGGDRLNLLQVGAGGFDPSGAANTEDVLQSPLGGTTTQQASRIAVDGAGNVFVGVGTANVFELALATPPSLDFDSTTVGSVSADSPQTVWLYNIGNEPLNFSSAVSYPADFLDPGTAESSTNCSASFTLVQGIGCHVGVEFKPSTAGQLNEAVVLTDNNLSVSGVTQSIPVGGTGIAVPSVSFNPTALTFPATTDGRTASAMSTVMTNIGHAPLTDIGIGLGGADPAYFEFRGTNNCPTSSGSALAAGASCTISVSFTPQAAVTSYSANISVAGSSTGPPQTVALTGAGIAPPPVVVTDNETIHTMDSPTAALAVQVLDAETIHATDKPAANLAVQVMDTETIRTADMPTLARWVLVLDAEIIHTTDSPEAKPTGPAISPVSGGGQSAPGGPVLSNPPVQPRERTTKPR